MPSLLLYFALPLLPIYLFLTRTLRYSRIKAVHATYAKAHDLAAPPPLRRKNGIPPTRKELPMTPAEAQKIMLQAILFEQPWTLSKALEFALFKHTTEFKDPALAGRRYVDTGLLIVSFMRYEIFGPGSGNEEKDGPNDPRQALATARMNWLHARYKSKISNDDLLYTLSTFMLEPGVWASQFEWRPLTPLEEQAFFVFFSEIGRRMGIIGIPTEIQGMVDWAEEYEKQYMVPKDCNRDVAEATTKLLLHNVPQFLHPLGTKVVACLLYDRLREAVMLPPPPPLLKKYVVGALNLRATLLRHLFPPRLTSQAVELLPVDDPAFPPGYIPIGKESEKDLKPPSLKKSKSDISTTSESTATSEESDSTAPSSIVSDMEEVNAEAYKPRMHPRFYTNEAWYMPEPTGLQAILNSTLLTLGLKRPNQLPGPAFKPSGFRFEEVGPIKYETKGAKEIQEMAEVLHGGRIEGFYAVGGAEPARCPYRV